MQGEQVVLVESLLQVGALLGDGLLEDGLLELKICRQSASPGERVALICLCLRLCFIVIVICFCLLRAGLDKVGMKNAC